MLGLCTTELLVAKQAGTDKEKEQTRSVLVQIWNGLGLTDSISKDKMPAFISRVNDALKAEELKSKQVEPIVKFLLEWQSQQASKVCWSNDASIALQSLAVH